MHGTGRGWAGSSAFSTTAAATGSAAISNLGWLWGAGWSHADYQNSSSNGG